MIKTYFISGVDPYGGRRKLSDEARIRESVTQTVLRDIQARARNQPVRQVEKQKKKESKKQKKKTVCQDFNTSAGCGNPKEACPKGAHKCSKSKDGFFCWKGHSAVSCSNPRVN